MNKHNVEKEYEELFLRYLFAQRTIEAQIDNLVDDYAYNHDRYNPVDHTKSRIKEFKSAAKKLKKKGLEVTPENMEKNLYDMVGFRIICPFISDVYEMVEQLRNSEQMLIVREDDYIKEPKESGYRSYHIDIEVPVSVNDKPSFVKAEIQVRTLAMDLWATQEHILRYKKDIQLLEDASVDFKAAADSIFRYDERTNMLNKELREEEEYLEAKQSTQYVKR